MIPRPSAPKLSSWTIARRPLLAFGLLLTLATSVMAEAPDATIESFGAAVGDLEPTPIATILAAPDTFAGQEVVIHGTVSGVCAKKGCWMELTDTDANSLRVKVEDDVIVFPASAEGNMARARGIVEVHDMDRAGYIAWRRHLAEEQGESFDESTIGEGPFRLAQLAGIGAAIETQR